MHRTEGENNDGTSGINLFKDGPPGTTVEQEWLNSIQEELALVLADTGNGILTAATDTRNQLRIVIAKKWTDIASAATVDIANTNGTYGDVTGVTTITALGTVASGSTGLRRTIHHTGIHILTHNATSMINITGANITTAVGDVSKWTSLGSGNWRMTGYSRADGTTLAATASAATINFIQGSSGNISTSSTSLVDMTDMSITWTASGGDVHYLFTVSRIRNDTAGQQAILQFDLGGVAKGVLHEYTSLAADEQQSVAMQFVETVAAGSKTAKVRWKAGANTALSNGNTRGFSLTDFGA